MLLALGAFSGDAKTKPAPDLSIGRTAIEAHFARQFWDYAPETRVWSEPGSGAPARFRFIVDTPERMAGITYQGPATRLRLVLERVRAGEAIRVGALGASITAGQGTTGNARLVTYGGYFTRWLNAVLPPSKPLRHSRHHEKRSSSRLSQRRRRSLSEAGLEGVEAARGAAQGFTRGLEQGLDLEDLDDVSPFLGEADTAAASRMDVEGRGADTEAEAEGLLGLLLEQQAAGFARQRQAASGERRRLLGLLGESLIPGGDGGPLDGAGAALLGRARELGRWAEGFQGREEKGEEGVGWRGAGSGGGAGSRRGLVDAAVTEGDLLAHHFYNGGVPGTTSAYMSSCVQHHIPEDVDLVLVEYSVNDDPDPSADYKSRRAFERLLRKVLALPSRPAVVLVHFFSWQNGEADFWQSAERDLDEFAAYYGLPSVSLRAAVVPALPASAAAAEALNASAVDAAKGKKGADFAAAYGAFLNASAPTAASVLPGGIYAEDPVHPGRGGHVVIAELLATLCLELISSNDRLRTDGGRVGELPSAAYLPGQEGPSRRSLLLPLPSSTDRETSLGPLPSPLLHARSRSLQASSPKKRSPSPKKRSPSPSPSPKRKPSPKLSLASRQQQAAAAAAAAARGPGWGDALVKGLYRLALRPLAEPLVEGNYAAAHSTCYVDNLLPTVVKQPTQGWVWTDEGRGKWGWVAEAQGSTIQLKLDTRVPGQAPADPRDAKHSHILLGIAYLESYKAMGRARVACVSGCECQPLDIDSLALRKASLTNVNNIAVSQHEACVVSLTTLGPGGGAGAGSKFKLMGLVVGEEAGAEVGTVNWLRGATHAAAAAVAGAEGGSPQEEGAPAAEGAENVGETEDGEEEEAS
ncbi:hypothetical protein HYH03_008056 [Edaphochlamys debaryana]|uniref:SGNH hydrolase-type esterase domain-containing protein n=1 Tax=Edaphochlamys debaryana TaxID=47281 RepID=A0A836BZX1_9CHLO|nr:hypothetical protein HYH03_008056 [Edaphochlamys debaryana]|eukprot:KAG2493839.1 hypothetical protein HYH03_008056 [Edaphochlamys debaryana]